MRSDTAGDMETMGMYECGYVAGAASVRLVIYQRSTLGVRSWPSSRIREMSMGTRMGAEGGRIMQTSPSPIPQTTLMPGGVRRGAWVSQYG